MKKLFFKSLKACCVAAGLLFMCLQSHAVVDEITTTIDITIQSAMDGSYESYMIENKKELKNGTSVSIMGDPPILSYISIDGPDSIKVGDTGAYTCTAVYSNGKTELVSPIWIIVSGQDYASITGNVLTGKAAGTTVVRAIYLGEGTPKNAEKNVKIDSSPLLIKMHQVSDSRGYQNATASAGADEPLIPLASETSLGSHLKEVSQGLVADGVTPLVFSVKETGQTTENHTYTIKLVSKNSGGSSAMEKLYVLNNGKYVQSNQLTIKAHPQGDFTTYFYLGAIKSEDISTSVSEVGYSIEITSGSSSEALAHQEFKIRRPPIVFVHGFNSNGEWGSDFLSSFYSSHPTDFIYVLKYGIDSSGDYYENTYGTLKHLVDVLDKELKKNVEGKSGNKVLWDGWACSRYDMVCHSQGGVLTRMLCSQNAVWGNDVPAYRNADNNYRGRFHRIVTIGSPQNGASILYYMIQMREKSGALLQGLIIPHIVKDTRWLYQEKFDPWGPQLREVNSKPIDPAAQFHAVRCQVKGISLAHHALGLGYKIGVLGGRTGEEIVHPYGSDGVVDMISQMAGGTRGSLYDTKEVCHAPVLLLVLDAFGTLYGETVSDFMGEYARQLLYKDGSYFGSFHVPTPAPVYWKEEIDKYVLSAIFQIRYDEATTSVYQTGKKVQILVSALSLGGKKSMVYAASDDTVPHWFAVVYGPDGITMEGITIEANPDNPFGAIVSIDESVIGDVVIYGNYQTEDGSIICVKPTVIYSNQPGTTISSIKMEPNGLTLAVGDVIEPDLWVSYSNQQSCQLFISDETNVTFTSSNPKVVKVEGYLLKALSAGTAVITAKYKGKTCTARYTVESSGYEEEGEFIDYEVNNDRLTIFFTGSLYESSNGVDQWKYISAESPYTVKMGDRRKFYRSAQ